MNSQSLSRGLAFFSIGLGLAELLAPRQLARAIGIDEDSENLLRLLGLREIGSGVGIMQGYAGGFLWSRVAGDAMDLGLLAAAYRSPRNDRRRLTGALIAVASVTVADIIAASLQTRNPAEPEWRVARSDRRGLNHETGTVWRSELNSARDEAASASPANEASGAVRARETAAIHQFEPGD